MAIKYIWLATGLIIIFWIIINYYFYRRRLMRKTKPMGPEIVDFEIIKAPKDAQGRVPLHIAVIKDKLETVKYLVEHGADINLKDARGWTPLHYAVERRLRLVRYLVEHGADLEAVNNHGETPLICAVQGERVSSLPYHWYWDDDKIVKYLVEQGANLNAKDANDRTPLYYAIDNPIGIIDVKYLIDHGANIYATAFHDAVKTGDLEMVKYLVEKGGDVNGKDYFVALFKYAVIVRIIFSPFSFSALILCSCLRSSTLCQHLLSM